MTTCERARRRVVVRRTTPPAERPNARLSIKVLGPLRVIDRAGRVLRPRGPTARLITVLALRRGRVATDHQLLEAIWPGPCEGVSAGALRTTVQRARDLLGDDRHAIERVDGGYRLRLDVNLDLDEPDDAITAATRYRSQNPATAYRLLDRALADAGSTTRVGELVGHQQRSPADDWWPIVGAAVSERIAVAEDLLAELAEFGLEPGFELRHLATAVLNGAVIDHP